jgi:hypothetical protein
MSANNWTLCPQCHTDSEDTGVTLREDYEFWGIEKGVLEVAYQAWCMFCDWRFTFNREVNTETNEETER